MARVLSSLLAAGLLVLPAQPRSLCSILVYHRFGPIAADPMTVRTITLRWQLSYLKEHGYHVVALRQLVDGLLSHAPAPWEGCVVITADDGHRSVYTDMLPVVRDDRMPVTLFIYPSAISRASYAMTWQQLDALRRTGLFDIESHTYWHPNFVKEKRRLSPAAYRTLATQQLTRPRTVLQQRLGAQADLLAWPFGIYDDELMAMAEEAGYVAGFTLERRMVTLDDRVMALPRFLVSDTATGRAFAAMLPRVPR